METHILMQAGPSRVKIPLLPALFLCWLSGSGPKLGLVPKRRSLDGDTEGGRSQVGGKRVEEPELIPSQLVNTDTSGLRSP